MLCLDACFLKGPWNRQVLVAVGRDANNQMYTVAWKVAQKECKETRMWFLQFLYEDLDVTNVQGWIMISYQQKVRLYDYFYIGYYVFYLHMLITILF